MKRVTVLIMLALVLVLLSGCVQGDFHVTVNKDKSADLNYKFGFSKGMLGLMAMGEDGGSSDPIGEMKKGYEKDGFKVVTYKEKGYIGVIARKHVANVEKLTSIGVSGDAVGNGSGKEGLFSYKVKEGLFQNDIRFKGHFDMTEMDTSSAEDTSGGDAGDGATDLFGDSMSGMLANAMDLKFTLTLPVKAESHNASRVLAEGNTYQWDLVPGEANQVELHVKAPNTGNIVGVSIGGVVVVGLVLWFVVRRKKKDVVVESGEV